ncbi:MAG: nucleotide pyrophosphatase/phosphodiesterase family protein [Verrucomicrobiota bacterium]
MAAKKLLLIQVAALGHDFLQNHLSGGTWQGLTFHPLEPIFPAVTCAAQASFRTAAPPSKHGMVSNGVFLRDLRKAAFWEQSAALVSGERIWESFRHSGKSVALLFWQQSLGEKVDYLVSPAPIHKHHGGMIQDCYSRPAELYARLRKTSGGKFKLQHYWGPFTSLKGTQWIALATRTLLEAPDLAPDLCLTYLPHLDYSLQKYGPDHPRSKKALTELLAELESLLTAAGNCGYQVLIFGDYAIGPVSQAAFPNKILREAGFLTVRTVGGHWYPDLYRSRAFAMVDHEMAHVYIPEPADLEPVREALKDQPGIGQVLNRSEQENFAVAHPRSGELLLIASPGCWLAYPWWDGKRQAPDYARHVDIHQKPGYDPCELFFGWSGVSQDASRIRGSHGRPGPDRLSCWAATFDLDSQPGTLLELSAAIRSHLL